MSTKQTVLVIDDDKVIQASIPMVLRDHFKVILAKSTEEALEQIKVKKPKAILLDIRLSNENGMDFLPKLVKQYPYIPVIMLTGERGIEYIKDSLNKGAYDFITKPYLAEDLINTIQRSLEEYVTTPDDIEFIGRSKKIQDINDLVKKAGKSKCNVLIIGESGTGKEVLAKIIHNYAKRGSYRPYVPINCGAIPENLIESTLFGHEAGAFTGALKTQRGKFELAHQGDVFLDEINSMPKEAQVRLLRVLQEKEFERIGSEKSIKSDFRVIAASNVDINLPQYSNVIREDLYYRLSTIEIKIPPLRERPEDIPLLINYFLQSKTNNPEEKYMSAELRGALTALPWPGNVRQLFNTLRQILVLSNYSELTIKDFPNNLRQINYDHNINNLPLNHFKQSMDDFERSWLKRAFNEKKHTSEVAESLGLPRSGVYTRVKKLGLEYLLKK